MISETRNRVEEVYHSTQDTHAAVQSLRMSEGIKWLPMGMEEMVKDTFRDVLVGFYHERAILQDQVVEQGMRLDDKSWLHTASRLAELFLSIPLHARTYELSASSLSTPSQRHSVNEITRKRIIQSRPL